MELDWESKTEGFEMAAPVPRLRAIGASLDATIYKTGCVVEMRLLYFGRL